MNIALIGATGSVGSRVLEEALRRGHSVTAVVRDPSKLPARPGLTVARGDALDAADLAKRLAGHDAVVSAYNPGWTAPNLRESTVKAYRGIVDAAKSSGVKRLVVVGGAGSLVTAPGQYLVDSPDFPAEWKPAALGMRDVSLLLAHEPSLDWTFFAPAPLLSPGARTGKFRVGGASLLPGDGPAKISIEDYAVALVDELEKPAHLRQNFTVGY
jgi:putative NADH-flavin reductase